TADKAATLASSGDPIRIAAHRGSNLCGGRYATVPDRTAQRRRSSGRVRRLSIRFVAADADAQLSARYSAARVFRYSPAWQYTHGGQPAAFQSFLRRRFPFVILIDCFRSRELAGDRPLNVLAHQRRRIAATGV